MKTQTRGIGDRLQAKELRRINYPQVGCNSSLIANPENVKGKNVNVLSVSQNIQGYPILINSQPSATMSSRPANRGTRTRGKGVELFYPGVFFINPNSYQKYRKSNTNIEYVCAYEMNNHFNTTGLIANYCIQINNSSPNLVVVLGLENFSSSKNDIEPDIRLNRIASARHFLTSKVVKPNYSFDFGNDYYNDSNMNYDVVTNFLTFTNELNRVVIWNAVCTSLLGSFAYTEPTRNRMYNLKKYIKTKLLNFLPYK